jgi:DNA-binding transcriptional ArsR family regulator
MLVVRFGPADLANIRFAISPLLELHASLRALRNPSATALHLPWMHEVKDKIDPGHLALLNALTPPKVYTPDFVNPPPHSPLAPLEDELEEMLATPAEQIRVEIQNAYRERAIPEILSPLLDEPTAALPRLAEVIRACWNVAIEPYWDRLRALFEGDVLYRARQMADGGARQLFSDLHPELTFEDEVMRVTKPWSEDMTLDGRGLLLVPSAFNWPALSWITKRPWQPTVVYPARGVGTLWDPGSVAVPDGLSELMGARRASVLASLETPLSTTDIARRLELSAASVSQHLSVLRGAGLVQASRVRRVVLYTRTPRGEALVRA